MIAKYTTMMVALLAGVVALAADKPADETSAGKVKISAAATQPDAEGAQTLTLSIQIDKGWYIYANPVDNQMYAPNATKVEITAVTPPESVKVEYPAGKVKTCKYFGPHKIYEESAEIKAAVRRAKGDAGKLEVSVQVNACDKDNCLKTGTIKLTVP